MVRLHPCACGLKSVSMYFSSDGMTQQVRMIPGDWLRKFIFTVKSNEEKVPKSMQALLKIEFLAVLGTLRGSLWSLLGKHLGHMFPKEWIPFAAHVPPCCKVVSKS